MNCDWVTDNLTFYLYDELPDDARFEVERHLEGCARCAGELQAAREFKATMATLSVDEPSPNLLASSRLRLQEALETSSPYRGWRSWVLEPARWFRQIKLAPAAAALLFIVGFGAGVGATYRLTVHLPSGSDNQSGVPNVAVMPAEASVLGVRGITQRPGTGQVDVRYDTVVPQSATGTPDDPRIQQLLLFAARSNTSSGVRVDSVELLAQRPADEQVRRALTYAVHYDSNPGVRLRAMQALGPYVKGDLQARDALVAALLTDSNPGVRAQAIQLLKPVRADASVRQVLERLAEGDRNAPIRRLSRSVLVSMPQID